MFHAIRAWKHCHIIVVLARFRLVFLLQAYNSSVHLLRKSVQFCVALARAPRLKEKLAIVRLIRSGELERLTDESGQQSMLLLGGCNAVRRSGCGVHLPT